MKATCPHCERDFFSSGINRHISTCVHRPEVREAVRVVMDDGEGSGKTQRDYEVAARAYNAQPGIGAKAPSLRAWLKEIAAGFARTPGGVWAELSPERQLATDL